MTAYSAELVPVDIMKEILETKWDDLNGEVPLPKVVVLNSGSDEISQDFEPDDTIIISADIPDEVETLRDAWAYKDMKRNVLLEITTGVNRQRLADIKKVIRGIIHTNKHNSTLTHFQVLRYNGSQELNREQMGVWAGQIRVSFESAGVILDVV